VKKIGCSSSKKYLFSARKTQSPDIESRYRSLNAPKFRKFRRNTGKGREEFDLMKAV
jgi:hypothetical protein